MHAIIHPILQKRNWKDKEVKYLAQGSTASHRQVRPQIPVESFAANSYTAQPHK